jgi:DNA-binding NarL/FixJ family response regulator
MESLTALIAIAAPVPRAEIMAALAARGFSIVAAPGDSTSADAAAVRERPEVCLIDLDLAGDALAAVGKVATSLRSTTIVAFAAVEDPAQMIAALERGASGYLSAGLGFDELAKTLRAAHAGEPALSRSLVPYLIEHMRHDSLRLIASGGRTVTVTPREWDVVELLREGVQSKEIARRLGLSPVTVRRHISSVVRKVGARDRAELVEMLRRLAS